MTQDSFEFYDPDDWVVYWETTESSIYKAKEYARQMLVRGMGWPYNFVYFLEIGKDLIKIGSSFNPKSRLASIKSKSRKYGYDEFRLLGVICGGYDKEDELHQKFSHLCVPNEITAELFTADPELRSYISSLRKEFVPESHWRSAGMARKSLKSLILKTVR